MASKSSSSNSSSVRSSSSNIINNNNISSSRGSLSPRMIVDPHCIPVPLAAHPADHEGNPMIVRPTPRRATESNPASSSSSSSAAGSDLNARREINKSLTGIANNNINISNNNHHKTSAQETTNKLKSLSPQMTNRSSASSSSASSRVLESEKYVGRSPVSKMGSSPDSHLLPERDTGASSSFSNKPWSSKSQGEAYFQKINAEGFVTNVMIDKLPDESSSSSSVTRVVQDSGYQILSSKDEEVERDNRGAAAAAAAAGHDHHGNKKIKSAASSSSSSNSKYKLNNQRYKPRRKAAPVSGQYKNPGKQHDHVKRNNISVAADKLGDEADRSKDNNINHLLDVKAAIERLNLHTPLDEQCSHSSSSYSSTSVGSESEPQANNSPKAPRGKGSKNLSQETLNTTVTSADEFVWIDSHNRLVELQQLPWTTTDIGSVIKRCLEYESSESTDRIGPDILPRLSYYLQRVLVRLAREAQRLSKNIGKCGKKEICTALKIVLSPTLATTAVRACLRAAAMFAISGDATRQSKSNRASLTLPVGRMHQWMCLVKVGKFIHEYAAIYLTAGMESILEEVVGHCLAVAGRDSTLTASLLEQVVSTNGEIWGIFQPYAHLSSSRVASGTLTLSPAIETLTSAAKSESGSGRSRQSSIGAERNVRQILLTTCVGSCDELEEMVLISGSIFQKVWQSVTTSSSSGHSYRPVSSTGGLIGLRGNLGWCADAIRGLYHFMRCSQLEYVGQDGRSPIQELVYERPYMVLPPIMEWVRVVYAFAEHRNATTIDSDDVLQAARILLPGMDCPSRPVSSQPGSRLSQLPSNQDELQTMNEMKREMAFQMLQSGRRDLVPHALALVPSSEKNSIVNGNGFTPLQMAAIRGDLGVIKILLDTGADLDGVGEADHKHWTPLTYATLAGHVKVVKLLLERGANVNGGDSAGAESPLQVAAGLGNVRIVELLISFGASPFSSPVQEDNLALPSASQAGCCSAVSVAAVHGHRRLLHIMVTQCISLAQKQESPSGAEEEVLSLEEILAEGISGQKEASGASSTAASNSTNSSGYQGGNSSSKLVADSSQSLVNRLSKSQVKKLQEAMYHASESANIELTLDLRNLGVPWSLYTWIQTLKIAHDSQIFPVMNELLQDFQSEWMEEHSNVFVDAGLPLLFAIFKSCKNESTILMLADIFSLCYGRHNDYKIELKVKLDDPKEPGPRIDPKFVNNADLSDVQFRVEGRIFYAHKLVLVTASPRFQSMLNSRFCEGSPPVLQINDIRYEIFHLVMTYLYKGGSATLSVNGGDVLELMAAANFFQLPGLLKYCEMLCSKLVDLDNIVSYYIHAKVYSALDLLEYCEGFLLKNMVALLTYDDSVKRLIFGKKLQSNHDVLGGLLANLQKRIKGKGK